MFKNLFFFFGNKFKEGEKVKNWKRRYFKLFTGGTFCYYNKPNVNSKFKFYFIFPKNLNANKCNYKIGFKTNKISEN